MVQPINWTEDESTERVVNDVWDKTTNTFKTSQGSIIPADYDYKGYTMTGNNITTIVYKKGGAGGSTVMTKTLAYDGSNNLTSITIS